MTGPVPTYLVVDDSPTIRLTLAAALRLAHDGSGIQVVEASTEVDAVQRFMEGAFDLVFLDMMIASDKSALDVLRAMLAARPDAKVIITTGLERENGDVIEAISMGAWGYLRKPVRAADVRRVIEEAAAESGRVGRIR